MGFFVNRDNNRIVVYGKINRIVREIENREDRGEENGVVKRRVCH